MQPNLDLPTLTKQLKTGELPLAEYLAETLELIDHTEPIIHALLPEPNRKQRYWQAAKVLLAKYPDPASRPPLFGVLIGVKDLFNVDGLPTRAGSKLPATAFTGKEAEIVTRLKNLGAIVLGKTVSTEFAYFSPGETCNPINPLHTPGGSSSGSAAAVAAGYCPVALGTQTIASIIRPASYCGVYGYKPSWGIVSTAGVFPFSQAADHVGFITNTLDTLLLLAHSLGIIPSISRTQPVPGLGAVRGTFLMQASECVRAEYDRCLEKLGSNGFRLVTLDPFGDIEQINSSHRKLIAAEFALNHKTLYSKYAGLYSRFSQELYSQGLKVNRIELEELRLASIELRERIGKIMKENEIDLWLTPSTTSTAPLGLDSTGSPLMSLPWTNAGLPSITIPSGFDEQGLPFGLQIISLMGYDKNMIIGTRKVAEVLYN